MYDLLKNELKIYHIIPSNGGFKIVLGDETVQAANIQDAIQYIESAIREIKEHIWEAWVDLRQLAIILAQNDGGNEGGLANILFLNSVKKSYLLSSNFTDLKSVSDAIYELLDIDAAEVHPDLISKFNKKYLEIRLLHRLIMNEIYRVQLLRQFSKITKQAQISGPWANLDLPIKERVWEWSEDEEYFDDRQRARRNQIRYNPEYNQEGFYFVWQDYNRDPYSFEDFKKDSPYKSRQQLAIP